MTDYRNPESVKEFITTIEEKLSVESWTLDGVRVWPFIRISLFFYLIGKKKQLDLISIKTNNQYKKPTILDRLKKTIFKFTHPIKLNQFFNQLSQKDIIIYSHKTYRTELNGKMFNKFFDPLIEQDLLGDKNDIYFIEDFYNYDKNSLKHSELILDIRMVYNYFLTNSKERQLILEGEDYEEFLNTYLSDPIFDDFREKLERDVFYEFYKGIYLKSLFFERLLRKVKPKRLYVSCHYCNSTIPITIAANKLGIVVIEMQHGAIDSNHIPYAPFSKTIKKGYQMLPNKIWCWDEESKKCLEENFSAVNIEPFVGGYPWLDYFNNAKSTYQHKNYLLYTLQPFVNYDILFTQSLINAINTLDHKWFIRLHPRQVEEKNRMIAYLKSNGADMNKINFDDATNDPLPLLISQCKLHITQFSSCTIEAALLHKKTLLLDEIAKLYFNRYIENNLAEYVEEDSILERIQDNL